MFAKLGPTKGFEMRCGHADAQFMFRAFGVALGYEVRNSWTRALPTDGVWLLPGAGLLLPEAPAVAIEVAVTEGPKAIKGSIDILAEVSPAIGILLINEVEIRRGEIRKGIDPEIVERRINQRVATANDRLQRHQQRIKVWSYAELQHRYRLATGSSDHETLARLSS